MPDLAPPIYVRLDGSPRMSAIQRLLALVIAAGALNVLLIAAYLHPDPTGAGTHTQLGMQPCQFLYATGLPCAGCGMTTAFSYFVRGDFLTSFYTQPFGMVLAVLTALTFWASLYCAITAKPSYRLLKLIPMSAHLWFWLGLGLFGWAWKMVVVIAGR